MGFLKVYDYYVYLTPTKWNCFDQYINGLESRKLFGKKRFERQRVNRFILDSEKVLSIEGCLEKFVIKNEHYSIYFSSDLITLI